MTRSNDDIGDHGVDSATEGRPERSCHLGTPRMMPGQTPYTEEELARLYEMVHWAAGYIEEHPEPLDIEQYTVYNTQTGERKREEC